ncbi:unnamed protein product [Peniophora sp. CBMAI 1063]|nr:unnamed protein product [Peniophora sp. CBMAI 1063]
MENFALEILFVHNPDRPAALLILGSHLRAHFERYGVIGVLQSSVARLHLANSLTTLGHPDKPARLANLGLSLRARYEHLGKIQDLHLALALHRLALYLTPDGRPDKPARLADFGDTMRTRFDRFAELDDLEKATAVHQRALDETSVGNVEYSDRLFSLGITLRTRFLRLDAIDDLQNAIGVLEQAVSHTPEDPIKRSMSLEHYGRCLVDRFRRLGELDDLEHAIATHEKAIELLPKEYPEKPKRLAALAIALTDRYRERREVSDLECAMEMRELALKLTPEEHPDRPLRLADLAISLWDRYQRRGDSSDLERTMEMQELALKLTSNEHPDRPKRLANLAVSLCDRYQRRGQVSDLEWAMELQELALELTPDDHPIRPGRLVNLAISLRNRYRRRGEVSDLERAMEMEELALKLTPEEHPGRPLRLANLAISLWDRYRRRGKTSDLKRAMEMEELALKLTPEDHPDRLDRLAGLAISLRDRYHRHGDVSDLERAMEMQELALRLTPEEHPDRPGRLASLAISLRDRYELGGDASDLEKAIRAGKAALKLTPDGDLYKDLRLYNLGLSLSAHLQRQHSKRNFDSALDCFMKAASESLGNPSDRLNAALECVSLLSKYPEFGSTEDLLLAHANIIRIFPEIVWLGHSLDRRFEESAKLASLVNAAVSAFIQSRSMYQAIEWMEAGRSLVWSQMSSLSMPLDDILPNEQPALASRLQGVLGKLRLSGDLHHERLYKSQSPDDLQQASHGNEVAHEASVASEEYTAEADRHRRLVVEYESTLKAIRSCPGFGNYMRPPEIKSLMASIERLDGPVVFINVDTASCDAVVLFPNGAVRHITLPDLTESRARCLRSRWMQCLSSSDPRRRGALPPDQCIIRGCSTMFGLILKRLWTWVAHPILQGMKLIDRESTQRLPHVTWCPTGPLTQLPLHAAGIYDTTLPEQARVFDFVVSSYTPSLSALLRCREGLNATPSEPRMLVVAQPETPKLAVLPGTEAECARLCRLFPDSVFMVHEEATVSATIPEISRYPWLHLACHGSQNSTKPTQSAFALYDGPLTLSALMNTVASDAELAFLSACQTAVGDEKNPEESIHLAAGMLAVGFKGVIATMWSIGDDDAPVVVEAYYKKLLELRSTPEAVVGQTGAAYALHHAVGVLRERVGERSFVRWAPYVHFGV